MPLTTETRNLIFNSLKKCLEKCSPPMIVKPCKTKDVYELIGNMPVPYGYAKKIIPGMSFAMIAQRKDSVTFHFFPCYMNTQLQSVAPSLYKCLKGKTCFHFKKKDEVNVKELEALLAKGMQAWDKAGYMRGSTNNEIRNPKE
jgi:hypothetical protein